MCHAHEMSAADYERTIAVNLSAPFFLIQAAIPHLLQVNGAVVNVDTGYDADGNVHRVSEPYTGVSATHWTVYSNYDALGRPRDISGPDGGSVHTGYTQESGLQKTEQTVTVVTPDGNRNLSAALPRTSADVEAWLAELLPRS